MYEIETNISEEEYRDIQTNYNNMIEKYRIKIPIDNDFMAELDLYCGKLEGLITIEVEFDEEEQINKFNKPLWFGNQIDRRIFSNADLSKISRKEFLNIIDEEELNNNMIIKNGIEEFIADLNY